MELPRANPKNWHEVLHFIEAENHEFGDLAPE
jgi:hypothetical protein